MNPSMEPGIVVNGRGKVVVASHSAVLDLGVSVVGKTAKEASETAARAANRVIQSLGAAGVEESEVKTANYTIQQEFDHTQDGRRLLGFRVDNDLTIRLNDTPAIGEILDEVVLAAGDHVVLNGISFDADGHSGAESIARRLAWEDAVTRATQYAELSGLTLGDAMSIEELGQSVGPIPMARMVGLEQATPIEPGTTNVIVELRVRFGIS